MSVIADQSIPPTRVVYPLARVGMLYLTGSLKGICRDYQAGRVGDRSGAQLVNGHSQLYSILAGPMIQYLNVFIIGTIMVYH